MIDHYSIAIVKNIYKKPKAMSEVTSQLIYGEKFNIIKKSKNWLKIKTSYDKYSGYIKNNKFTQKLRPTYKTHKLKTKIFYKKKNKKEFLPFNSRLELINKKGKYFEFEKNKWVKFSAVKKIEFKEKNYTKILKYFKGCKYLWGGKTFKGIDCSALIQIYYHFNNKFFHRDTKDQIKKAKKLKNLSNFERGNIIYWKGHVAVCIDKKRLIHAYGPKKKVLIMNIKNTIKKISETAQLEVIKISKI